MFLFGSLTTLFPYALTIIAMFFCIFTGTPIHETIVNKTNEASFESSILDNDDTYVADFCNDDLFEEIQQDTHHALTLHIRLPWALRPFLESEYHNTLVASNGNKAPPYLA